MNHEERKVAVSNLEHNKEAEDSKETVENSQEETTPEQGQPEASEKPDTEKGTTDSEPVAESSSDSEANEMDTSGADSAADADAEQAAAEGHNADTGAGESDSEETEEETASESGTVNEDDEISGEEATPEETIEYYSKIAERARELVAQTDWALVSSELAALAQSIAEGPAVSGGEAKQYLDEFQTLRKEFEEKKKAHYEQLTKKKQENLARKKELLKTLSEIISNEKWNASKEIGQIKGQWESIKLLPQGEAETLNTRYNALLEEFEEHKVDRLVKKLQKEEENLELKLLLLDKMDALNKKVQAEGADFENLVKEFEGLSAQWRKVGRVPVDKNQMLWERFHATQDLFNEMRFKYDSDYRKSIEKALKKKKQLIKEAEALVDFEDLALAARKVNKLHKTWKKAGNLPQREENEMWDLFKAATDAFNDKKSENIDVLRSQEDENLEKKMELINKAEEAKDIEDYEKGHQIMQDLMKQWKNIGPVPRKKSSKIWKKFKGEMDEFYAKRRESFKEQRQDQKENLAKKQAILEKLQELGKHEDPAAAVEEAKKLQEEFKEIGHVPVKLKNKIWKKYRESCDLIYERFRALGGDLKMEKKLASAGIEPSSRREIIKNQKQIAQLKKEISTLESEIIQYQEAKTYFKPTNKGNVLREELQDKIEKAENSLAARKEKVYKLEREVQDLTESDEDED